MQQLSIGYANAIMGAIAAVDIANKISMARAAMGGDVQAGILL